MTFSEFITHAKRLHGPKFDYSSVKYCDSKTPVIVVCPEHGKIRIKPTTHLKRSGCGSCNITLSTTTKLTTVEFIRRSKLKHGDIYDYSKTNYKNWIGKVIITCPIHGDFTQRADRHMYHNGCPACFGPKEYTTESFIKHASLVHKNTYNYSKTEYINTNTKIVIICTKHGEFLQSPSGHLSGQGCPKCGRESVRLGISKTTTYFVQLAKKVHGDYYDYSKTEYTARREKLLIICPIHGEFSQIAAEHLRGRGCKLCGRSRARKQNTTDNIKKNLEAKQRFLDYTKTTTYDYSSSVFINSITKIAVNCRIHGDFLVLPKAHIAGTGCKQCEQEQLKNDIFKKLKILHKNRYDYNTSSYSEPRNKISIICQKHGEFRQTVVKHLKGNGCPKCLYDTLREQQLSDGSEFFEKAKRLHHNRYSYGQYKGINSDIEVVCKEHGSFFTNANQHLVRMSGCPKCSTSAEQNELLNIVQSFYKGQTINNDRSAIKPLEIDIFLPELKLGIEFHGSYWHSYDSKECMSEILKHSNKHDICLKNGIKLIQIFDYELHQKREIIISMIRNHLGLTQSIYARNCELCVLTDNEYRILSESNHIQGYRAASVIIGLKYQETIVCCMSFARNLEGYEIIRFFNILEHRVIGGASKILHYFIEQYHPSKITTFADRRFSTGELYKKLGFNLIKTTKPNYSYMSNGVVLSRQKCQKRRLNNLLGDLFDGSKSESENMFQAGYRRLWDAGHYKFELSLPTLNH